MKEVFHAGNHRDRKRLGPRPVHYICQGYRLIPLAVDHQCARMQIGGDGRHGKPSHRSAYQHQFRQRALANELGCGMADYKSAEGKPCKRK